MQKVKRPGQGKLEKLFFNRIFFLHKMYLVNEKAKNEIMKYVIFNTTNIWHATWLEREEIRRIHILNNNYAEIYLSDGCKVPVTAEEIKPVMEELRRVNSHTVKKIPHKIEK